MIDVSIEKSEYVDQLRELASDLVVDEELERRRLAEDLHDTVGQMLSASIMQIDFAEQRTGEDSLEYLGKARESVSNALDAARSLMFQLSPPTLYSLGIDSAIEGLTEQMSQLFNVRIKYRPCAEQVELSESNRIIAYRSIRDLLLNAVKRGNSTEIELTTCSDVGNFIVTIKCDGVLFEGNGSISAMNSEKGISFFSLEERLRFVGGRVDISSVPEDGDEITISVPVKISDNSEA